MIEYRLVRVKEFDEEALIINFYSRLVLEETWDKILEDPAQASFDEIVCALCDQAENGNRHFLTTRYRQLAAICKEKAGYLAAKSIFLDIVKMGGLGD